MKRIRPVRLAIAACVLNRRRPIKFGNSGSADPAAAARALGRRGERLAALYLWSRGCRILYRNFRPPRGGEVDIVARDRKVLVFAEVKTRSSDDFLRPAAAVNERKRRLITRGAAGWLRLLGDHVDPKFRFDIVEVILAPSARPEIRHLQAAFPEPTDWG